MIYIRNNGGEYSRHEIAFIETDLPHEHVVKLLTQKLEYWEKSPEILGVAEKIDWWSGGTQSLEQFLYYMFFMEDAVFASAPIDFWREIIRRWRADPELAKRAEWIDYVERRANRMAEQSGKEPEGR